MDVNLCEVGIFSGGSLEMWKQYFGPACRVFGIDIEEACRSYEDAQTTVLIGDQADRRFWASIRNRTPMFDIFIDDGGHEPEQQIVTLEEVLPHMRPGGVYVCEDIHGLFNEYSAYVRGLAEGLNAWLHVDDPSIDGIVTNRSQFQRGIQSIHLYPFVTVIEMMDRPVDRFIAPRHGSEWQPFA